MLEPASSALFNTVFNGPRIPSSSSFNAAARSMKRTSNRTVGADFFSPRPRRVSDKGKEKALSFLDEPPCMVGPMAHCWEWSCVARHSFACPKRNRVLLANEFNDSPPRKPLPQRVSSPLRRHSSRRNSLRLSGQRRHASGLHDLGTSSNVDTQSPPPEPEQDDSKKYRPPVLPSRPIPPDRGARSVRSLEDALSDSTFDARNAWQAYSLVAEEDALHRANITTFFALSERILRTTEARYSDLSKDHLFMWGDRLQRMLEYTASRISPLSPFSGTYRCLLARTCALMGHHDDAAKHLQFAWKIQSEWPSAAPAVKIFYAYECIVRSIRRYHGAGLELLHFLGSEWQYLGQILTFINVPRELGITDGVRYPDTNPRYLQRFRSLVYELLHFLNSPVNLWRQVEPVYRQYIGTLLIRVLTLRSGNFIPAFQLFRAMHQENFVPHYHIHLFLVRYLVRDKSMAHAKQVFLVIVPKHKDKAYFSTRLYLFGQDGDHKRAEEVYAQLEDWGKVTREDRSNLLNAYGENGMVDETLAVWDRLFGDGTAKPDMHNYLAALIAFARCGDIDGLNQWLNKMAVAGYPPRTMAFNITFEAFAWHGDVKSIQAGMARMREAGVEPDKYTFTTLIAALGKKQDPVGAERVFKQALNAGIYPDRVMFNALMNAHIESSSWKGAVKTFDYMTVCKIAPSLDTYNILLEAYVMTGAPLPVISRLFLTLQEMTIQPDQYTYSLAILAACDNGHMQTARKLFAQMEQLSRKWRSNMRLTVYTVTIIMAGYLRLGQHKRAKGVYDAMIRHGINPTSTTYSEIIRSYARDGRGKGLELAEEFIAHLMSAPPESRTWLEPPRGTKSSMDSIYAPLMFAYSQQKRPEDVERLFKEMVDAGGKPTLGTLTALLDAYRRSEQFDAALAVWPHIFEIGLKMSEPGLVEEGSPPRRIQTNLLCLPFSLYIDILSSTDRHAEIADVWKDFQREGLTFNSHNYNHLIMALVRAGEIERAFEIVEKVLLPFQRRHAVLRRKRDKNPQDPFVFTDQDAIDEQPGDSMPRNIRRKKNREVTHKLEHIWDHESEDDVADHVLPIYLVHQISPGFSTWRPHKATHVILLLIICRLREGFLVQALNILKPDEPVPTPTQEDIISQRMESSELLNALQTQFPDTYNLLMEFDTRERQRLGRRGYMRRYLDFK